MIEEMPNKATLALCQQAWSLSNPIFVRKQENIVYICQQAGRNVFLRFTTPLRRSKSLIQAEIEFITYLAQAGLRVARPIKNHQDQTQMTIYQGVQQYEVVVFTQVSGDHPSDQLVVTSDYLKSLGALMATMHKATRIYQPKVSSREHWFEERGIRHAYEAAQTSSNAFMKEQLYSKLKWIETLPKTADTYGLVHGDLGSFNLFVSPNQSIGVIDFDDSCYQFFAFDLAIAIYSIAIQLKQLDCNHSEQMWIDNLLEGYQSIHPISAQQIESIPTFIDFASLRLYFWIEYHENLKTFHSNHIELALKMKSLTFKRICNQSMLCPA